jgi:HlyD family secretion protein
MELAMIRDTSAQDQALAVPRHRRWTRWGAAAAGAALLVAVGASLLSGWNAGATSVNASRLRIASVSRGPLVRDAAVTGRVVAAVSPTLYAAAPATVLLKVNAGDTVKKGQVLAELASPDLAGALQRERSTFQELAAEIERQQIIASKQRLIARRDADQAEIERAAAQRALERIQHAGVEGVVARNDFERAQDALKSAEIRRRHAAEAATLENSDVDLQIRTRREQLARQRLQLQEAQRRVEDLSLRAPMDGVVGSLAVADRAVVAANAPLLTLVDLARLEVELEIPETYVAELGLGMKVEITAGDIRAVGKLSAISPEVVKSTVLARVRFSGAQPAGLRQSQRINARLLIDEKPDALVLPRGPFVEAQGGRFVYVVENGIAWRRPVTLGATSVGTVEILAGLKPGDRVVVAGAEAFDNAAQVKINE